MSTNRSDNLINLIKTSIEQFRKDIDSQHIAKAENKIVYINQFISRNQVIFTEEVDIYLACIYLYSAKFRASPSKDINNESFINIIKFINKLYDKFTDPLLDTLLTNKCFNENELTNLHTNFNKFLFVNNQSEKTVQPHLASKSENITDYMNLFKKVQAIKEPIRNKMMHELRPFIPNALALIESTREKKQAKHKLLEIEEEFLLKYYALYFYENNNLPKTDLINIFTDLISLKNNNDSAFTSNCSDFLNMLSDFNINIYENNIHETVFRAYKHLGKHRSLLFSLTKLNQKNMEIPIGWMRDLNFSFANWVIESLSKNISSKRHAAISERCADKIRNYLECYMRDHLPVKTKTGLIYNELPYNQFFINIIKTVIDYPLDKTFLFEIPYLLPVLKKIISKLTLDTASFLNNYVSLLTPHLNSVTHDFEKEKHTLVKLEQQRVLAKQTGTQEFESLSMIAIDNITQNAPFYSMVMDEINDNKCTVFINIATVYKDIISYFLLCKQFDKIEALTLRMEDFSKNIAYKKIANRLIDACITHTLYIWPHDEMRSIFENIINNGRSDDLTDEKIDPLIEKNNHCIIQAQTSLRIITTFHAHCKDFINEDSNQDFLNLAKEYRVIIGELNHSLKSLTEEKLSRHKKIMLAEILAEKKENAVHLRPLITAQKKQNALIAENRRAIKKQNMRDQHQLKVNQSKNAIEKQIEEEQPLQAPINNIKSIPKKNTPKKKKKKDRRNKHNMEKSTLAPEITSHQDPINTDPQPHTQEQNNLEFNLTVFHGLVKPEDMASFIKDIESLDEGIMAAGSRVYFKGSTMLRCLLHLSLEKNYSQLTPADIAHIVQSLPVNDIDMLTPYLGEEIRLKVINYLETNKTIKFTKNPAKKNQKEKPYDNYKSNSTPPMEIIVPKEGYVSNGFIPLANIIATLYTELPSDNPNILSARISHNKHLVIVEHNTGVKNYLNCVTNPYYPHFLEKFTCLVRPYYDECLINYCATVVKYQLKIDKVLEAMNEFKLQRLSDEDLPIYHKNGLIDITNAPLSVHDFFNRKLETKKQEHSYDAKETNRFFDGCYRELFGLINTQGVSRYTHPFIKTLLSNLIDYQLFCRNEKLTIKGGTLKAIQREDIARLELAFTNNKKNLTFELRVKTFNKCIGDIIHKLRQSESTKMYSGTFFPSLKLTSQTDVEKSKIANDSVSVKKQPT